MTRQVHALNTADPTAFTEAVGAVRDTFALRSGSSRAPLDATMATGVIATADDDYAPMVFTGMARYPRKT